MLSPHLRGRGLGGRAPLLRKVDHELFAAALANDVPDKETGVVAALLAGGIVIVGREIFLAVPATTEDEAVHVGPDVGVGTSLNPGHAVQFLCPEVGRRRYLMSGAGAAATTSS